MKPVKGLKTPSRKKTTKTATRSAGVSKSAAAVVKQASSTSALSGNGGNGSKEGKAVTIEARIDVGFGNTLYLRGEGQGLNWNQGVPLKCVNDSTWTWTGEAADKLKFKLLLNDAVWSKGENLEAKPGQRLEVTPAF